jgi:transcriptional regulator with XRE-family HTH domain
MPHRLDRHGTLAAIGAPEPARQFFEKAVLVQLRPEIVLVDNRRLSAHSCMLQRGIAMPRGKKESTQPKRVLPADAAAGQRLRLRRIELGLSQTVIGEQLGITFQQVQKYENGTNRLSGGRLQQLAEFLKVPITYFFDDGSGAKKDSAKDIVTQMLLTRDGSKLCAMWLKMLPPMRRKVLGLIEMMAA